MSTAMEKFKEALIKSLANPMRKDAPVQIEWGEVISVESESCTVHLITDPEGMNTEGIRLGIAGNIQIKPKKGAICLVGHLHNNDAEGMVLWAAEIDLMTFNGDDHGGILIVPKLVDELNKLKAFQQKVMQVFNQWVVSPSDGGAALKALSQQFSNMQTPSFTDLENEKLKHGGN